ncbi:MAG: transglycosylase SLT domain-containing protein [Bryobacterales bacterium]|nr:transglycosylase SLT domain-containing protein [Bryobacterales bacterium]
MKIQQICNCTLYILPALLIGVPLAAPAKPRNVRVFVPPATKPLVQTFAIEEQTLLENHLVSKEHAVPEKFAQTPEKVEIDMRVSRARLHLKRGSELLNKGQSDSARTEFDRAVQLLASAPESLPGRAALEAECQKLVEEIYRLEVDAASLSSEPTPVFDRSPIDDIASMTFPIEPGLKGKVTEQLQSTASQLPLEMADPVLQFINYFSSPRGRLVLESGLKRSGRYAPMIRRILDEEGLPQELIFLAQAESAFLPRAVSIASATGMWQFMQSRGREYGLMQSQFTDDRLDPEKATRAAARHLRDLYTEFGDWYLAVAAYNCGPVTVERAIQRTGYADFWELYSRNVLPRETSNYLPIILAMTIMAKNAKDYGLANFEFDSPLEYDTVKMTAPTHLALIADLTQRPLQEVREMNPALLRMMAPAGYEVHVAKGIGRTLVASLEQVPSARRAAWRVHRVSGNETVASIARQYRIPEKTIAEANGSEAFEPQAGDFVMIPVSYPGPDIRPASMMARSTVRGRSASRQPVRRPSTVQTARRPASPNAAVAHKSAAPAPAARARQAAKPVQRATRPAAPKRTVRTAYVATAVRGRGATD